MGEELGVHTEQSTRGTLVPRIALNKEGCFARKQSFFPAIFYQRISQHYTHYNMPRFSLFMNMEYQILDKILRVKSTLCVSRNIDLTQGGRPMSAEKTSKSKETRSRPDGGNPARRIV